MGWREYLGFKAAVPAIASPWAPADDLVTFTASELLGEMSEWGAITRDIGMRVAPLRRAHDIVTPLVAAAPLRAESNGTVLDVQPVWLTNSQSGVSPYHRMLGVASDMFWHGWACLGFELGDDKYPVDALHIPQGYWRVDANKGEIVVDDSIPTKYRQRLVAIPRGGNGVLVDGADYIRAARAIEKAWIDRVQNPVPQTNLHITDPQYDSLNKRQKLKIVDEWNAQRKRAGGQTALTPSFIDVKPLGQSEADLFEKGRNAIRLDLANTANVPASILEGSKQGGGGDIRYSNETNARSELYDFSLLGYVKAIEGRLSLDDVCPPGTSLRFDRSELTSVPSPAISAPTQD